MRSRRAGALLTFLLCVAAVEACLLAGVQAPLNERRLLPVDEAKSDTSLLAFRTQLRDLVRTRNTEAVLRVATDEVRRRLNNGAGGSPLIFPVDWDQLSRLLDLGGSFTESRGKVPHRREFCAPYTYSAFPTQAELTKIVGLLPGFDEIQGELDPGVVIGRDVRVRERPSNTAPVLGVFSYALVLPAGPGAVGSAPDLWRELYLTNDRTGWIPAALFREFTDYRACFAKLEGAWKMTLFERD